MTMFDFIWHIVQDVESMPLPTVVLREYFAVIVPRAFDPLVPI